MLIQREPLQAQRLLTMQTLGWSVLYRLFQISMLTAELFLPKVGVLLKKLYCTGNTLTFQPEGCLTQTLIGAYRIMALIPVGEGAEPTVGGSDDPGVG